MAEEKRVLVVDDDPVVRQLLSRLIQRNGYEVAAFGNPADAITVLKSGAHFDLAFVDLILPNQCGWEIMDQIRSAPPPKTPIVVLTGAVLSEDAMLDLSNKSDALIRKDEFDIIAFEKVLNNFLRA